MIHDVQAHMLQMNVAIAAMIAGRLRRRRRDHAVTRIHDKFNLITINPNLHTHTIAARHSDRATL